LSTPELRLDGRSLRGTPLFFSAVERDDDLFPSLQVFHLDHAVRIPGLQKLRAVKSEVPFGPDMNEG
jgi:hypothetical protein